MTKKLGKGLEALIKTHDLDDKKRFLDGQVPLNKIQPNKSQPRQRFNDSEMQELIDSIKEKGVLQPITVRELNSGMYTIIAGERRYRASKKLGLKWIPAYTVKINNESEMMEYALIENIQRVNLNPIEEAEGYAILKGKYNLSQQNIARKVSKSRSEITNKLRLLKLPPIIKDSLRDNLISYGHARALLSIKKSIVMMQLYYKIINQNLSVRDTEKLIKLIIQKENRSDNNKKSNKIQILEKKLKDRVDTDVSINLNKKKSGNIKIAFSSYKQLNEIIKILTDE
tara:strand:- start:134 stop:985 length:852 start_codon:yes stop_codon:yes gene_type:complete